MNIAIVRGKFLNAYEMQTFAPLTRTDSLTAFGSLFPYHDVLPFPIVKLPSPMDIPDFRYKMPILNRIFSDAHVLFGLEDRLKGFDIVHTAETYYSYTRQCLDAKAHGKVRKVVATVLENIPFNNEGIWGRKALKENARKNLDHIIALTKRTREALILEGADESKITVIGHGIDTERFMPDADHWQTLGRHDTGPLTILFSGRLERYKGVFELLYAARMLLADDEVTVPLHFVFVGQGSQMGRMLKLEREIGIDRYVTHKSVAYGRMKQAYDKADIFVAPSRATPTWQEQYCTVLLEAQSMGLPIVTTVSGGIPENTGETALYANPGDVVSLAAQIKRFILDPKLRVGMGRTARARALSVHDARKVAKRIRNVYTRVLDG